MYFAIGMEKLKTKNEALKTEKEEAA
jgi:hypothetical protein